MIKHFDLLLFYVDDFIKHCFILDTTFRSKYSGPNPCVVIALENMPVKLKYYLSWKSDLGTDIFICHTTRAVSRHYRCPYKKCWYIVLFSRQRVTGIQMVSLDGRTELGKARPLTFGQK